MDGRWETPLSSWKKIQAFRRRAFFLPGAIFDRPNVSLSPDSAPGLAGRVAVVPSPSLRGSSTRVPGDSVPPSIARQQPPPEGASTNLCQNRGPLLLFAVRSRHVPVAVVPTSVCDPLDPRLVVPFRRHASIARTNDLHFGGLPPILGQYPPGSSCQPRTTEPLASVVAPWPRSPAVVECEFPCIALYHKTKMDHRVSEWVKLCPETHSRYHEIRVKGTFY